MRRTALKRGDKPLERRTPLAQGDKPLERRTGLSRSTELRVMAKEGASPEDMFAALKRSAPKRRPKKKRDELERELMAAWYVPVEHKDARCVVCGKPQTPPHMRHHIPPEQIVDLQGHHVIEQQTLERIAKDRGIPAMYLLWDPRCRVIVCELDHERHTKAVIGKDGKSKRIPMRCLTAANLEFASDLGLEWLIEQRYPLAGRIGR